MNREIEIESWRRSSSREALALGLHLLLLFDYLLFRLAGERRCLRQAAVRLLMASDRLARG